MRAAATASGLSQELAYLRAMYELSSGEAMRPVFYGDINRELDMAPDRADEAAYFWVDRGILEWTAFGHVALTHTGLKKAERLAGNGWSVSSL